MGEFVARTKLYVKLAFATGLLLLRNRALRRKLMFFVSIAAMLAVFVGGVLIIDFLVENPWLFVIYWFLAGTLVLSMILLALYDMLRVKGDQAMSERAELMDLLAEIEKAAAAEEGDDPTTKEEAN